VAAQFLSGRGFEEVYNLKGGILAWQGLKAKGPVELNLDLITGEESPVQMIAIAYGLEIALEKFYLTVIARIRDQAVMDLLKMLWAMEERHKSMLREHYQKLKTTEDQDLPENGDLSTEIIEGGFRFSEFLKQNEESLQDSMGVLDLAMMIETQALDLYLRFGQKITLRSSQEVLFRIADEEKAHLSSLGRLLETKIERG
jgi:sulfur-carrier protein adenylyltransferase/sulfurtransferase